MRLSWGWLRVCCIVVASLVGLVLLVGAYTFVYIIITGLLLIFQKFEMDKNPDSKLADVLGSIANVMLMLPFGKAVRESWERVKASHS
jgi:hypothetical protein